MRDLSNSAAAGEAMNRPWKQGDNCLWITRDESDAHLQGLPQTAWQRRIEEESKRNIEPSR